MAGAEADGTFKTLETCNDGGILSYKILWYSFKKLRWDFTYLNNLLLIFESSSSLN